MMLRIHGDQTSLIAALTKDWRHKKPGETSSTLADLMSHWADRKIDMPHDGHQNSTQRSK